jgi:hypothetical protein
VRKIYVFEASGFPEIQELLPNFIDTKEISSSSIEVVEWTPVGGLLISDCLYICIKFKQGNFIKAYIAKNASLFSVFEVHGVRTINIIDGDSDTEGDSDRALQIDVQYKDFSRSIGKRKKKQMLALLDDVGELAWSLRRLK